MLVSTMTDDQLTALANSVKEQLLETLADEGALKEEAQALSEKYAVILHRRGFFGRIIDKMFGVSNDNLLITVVKVL